MKEIKASQYYHLVKGLLRNKDINKKSNLDILKLILRGYYYMEQRPGHNKIRG